MLLVGLDHPLRVCCSVLFYSVNNKDCSSRLGWKAFRIRPEKAGHEINGLVRVSGDVLQQTGIVEILPSQRASLEHRCITSGELNLFLPDSALEFRIVRQFLLVEFLELLAGVSVRFLVK